MRGYKMGRKKSRNSSQRIEKKDMRIDRTEKTNKHVEIAHLFTVHFKPLLLSGVQENERFDDILRSLH